MFLFMHDHIEPILSGKKTQTRRVHRRPRALVGSVHQCRTTMLDTDSTFATIRILRVWQEHLGHITTKDARAEGGYTPKQYIKLVKQMYKGEIDEHSLLYCYEFELVADIKKMREGIPICCPLCASPSDVTPHQHGKIVFWKCSFCEAEFEIKVCKPSRFGSDSL